MKRNILRGLVQAGLLTLTMGSSVAFADADGKLSYGILNITEIKEGSPWTQLIESQDEWETFYSDPNHYFDLSVAPPVYDFDQNSILVGGLGAEYSNSSMMIRYLKPGTEKTYLGIHILTPGPSCIVPTEQTHPTMAILIPQSDLNIEYHVTEVVVPCYR